MSLALLTEQWAKFHPVGERWLKLTAWWPVPLLSIVLLLIAASQLTVLLGQFSSAFSLGTRSSFVVLPFALALPESWSVVVTIVVLQPLVELTGMMVYLWWVPQRLLKDRSAPPTQLPMK
ncbi:hypothetical protein [Leptodesmis sichuanensis]|uniref:hypothetical protein n=1 Tax=Leptodesmis sichuanensis TaxID=2906798 RepID=UPI001F439AA4|nr:hypothetical protein [Leptodesmis sichuanensis]UIE37213.1 hypothetical protein KIK02_19965 [Leptodesmis sichuanensis A121]